MQSLLIAGTKNGSALLTIFRTHSGDAERLNNELDRMIRIVQDIVSYAAKNKIEERGSFVKKTFKPDFDIRALNTQDTTTVIEAT